MIEGFGFEHYLGSLHLSFDFPDRTNRVVLVLVLVTLSTLHVIGAVQHTKHLHVHVTNCIFYSDIS